MAKVKIRALQDSCLEHDIAVIANTGGVLTRFPFRFSPKGTADASVVETEIADALQTAFEEEVAAMEGYVIKQNPNWDDVKTDTDGDGVSDKEPLANWATTGKLYEIIV